MLEQYEPLVFPPVTAAQAERRRKRLLRRRSQTMPLFDATGVAEQVMPVPDAETIRAEAQAMSDAYVAQLNRVLATLSERANDFRAQVAARVSPEQLAEMDAYRARVYPPGPEHAADYWRRMLLKLEAGA